MKKLSIFCDAEKLKFNEIEKEHLKKYGYAVFFEPILNQALQSKFERGVPLIRGKVLSRIQRKLDAIPVGESTLVLEEAEFDLIKEVFQSETVTFIPQSYRLVSTYLDNIENVESFEVVQNPE